MTDSTWVCEKCGATVKVGDWPTCKGKPEDHDTGGRLKYGFKMPLAGFHKQRPGWDQ